MLSGLEVNKIIIIIIIIKIMATQNICQISNETSKLRLKIKIIQIKETSILNFQAQAPMNMGCKLVNCKNYTYFWLAGLYVT